jgi:glyoxylase-like metal-dependent hydrolase (beta-lactamase superfamily II)/rhodanese-related sulfurtransferase
MEHKQLNIDAETLRKSLEEGKQIVVLDVRPTEQREEWFIPGSIHIDAYKKLNEGDSSVFDSLNIPENTQVVTVCAAGRTSQIASTELRKKGIEAFSLEGGMKAWSASWNTASVEDKDLVIVQVRRTGKGCLSYMLASENEAVVIDASVDVKVFESIARERNWKIKYVLDTHVHADHLSRTPDLAAATGADLLMPNSDKLKFEYKRVNEGSEIKFGESTILAIHTPGHTADSTSYLINGQYVLTGDTLFIDGVGRPDLKADEDQAKFRAGLLFESLQRIISMNESIQILPGHISKPIDFDKKIISGSLKEIKQNVKSLSLSKDEFINTILSKLPPTPPNFIAISEINLTGNIHGIDTKEIEAGANRCAIS